MQAKRYSAGFEIHLNGPCDRATLNWKKTIACRLRNCGRNAQMRVSVRRIYRRYDAFAEPGFHIRHDGARSFEVIISPEIYERLTTTGYYVSRSRFDRVDITYWEPGMKF